MTTPKIEFKDVVRDCPYNVRIHALKANGRHVKDKILVDTEVYIDDEHRATFRQCHRAQGYVLHDLAGQCIEIPRQQRSRDVYFRGGGERAYKKEFRDIIQLLWGMDKIPTTAQTLALIKARKEKKKDDDAAKWAQYVREYRERRTQEKADELLDLLTNVDKSSETAWHRWLWKRDSLVAYISDPPPRDEAHSEAAGIYPDKE